MIRRTFAGLLLASTLLFALATPTFAQAMSLADQMNMLAFHAREGQEAAEQGDAAVMQREVVELNAVWQTMEDDVGASNPGAYGRSRSPCTPSRTQWRPTVGQ